MVTHAPGTATPASFTPTYDGNGNVSEYLTVSANPDLNGTTDAHLEYDPFGNTLPSSTRGAEPFAHRFSTKLQDSVSGLYYYGYRWYDPITGRWLSRDPICEQKNGRKRPRVRSREERNLYAFLSGDPVDGIDPQGLKVLSRIAVSFESSGTPNAIPSVTFADNVERPSSGRRFYGQMYTHYKDGGYWRYLVKTGGNIELKSRIYKRTANGRNAWDPVNDDTATPSGDFTISTTINRIGYDITATPGRSAIQIHYEATTTGCIVFDRDSDAANWMRFKCDMEETKASGRSSIPIKLWYSMVDGSRLPHGNRADGTDDPGGTPEPFPDTEGPFEQPRHGG